MNKNIKVMGSVILSAVLAQSMLPFHVYALEDENNTDDRNDGSSCQKLTKAGNQIHT